MIILDTNVVSALMQEPGDRRVSAWLDAQRASSVWTTSVTVLEIRYGIERLAEGRKRTKLASAFARLVGEALERRILGFDAADAAETASLMARRQAAGRPIGLNDSMIAGIARAHRASFATRNTRHFEDAGIDLVNPWSS